MKEAHWQTRSHLMNLFQAKGFHPRTDLGQNFLIDLNILEYIVEHAELGPHDVVLEIGAGTGGLTQFLAETAAAVVSVEIDDRMFAFATESIAIYNNVTLLNCDALYNKNTFSPLVLQTVREKLAAEPQGHLKLVANLPYSVATPVISNLVASDLPWELMVVTIQQELAERMRAIPGSDDYSALSVWLQSQCRVKILKKIKPTVFWPRPQVNSAIVRLTPDAERKQQIADREFFHDFVRRLFHHRRKFLRSVIAGMYSQNLPKTVLDDALRPFEFKEGVRAEELDVPMLVKVAEAVRQAIKNEQAAI